MHSKLHHGTSHPTSGRRGRVAVVDDIFAIQILKAGYFRAIDTKDWELLASVMVEDVAIDVTDDVEGGRPYVGRTQFVDTCAKVLRDAVTVHHGHMPEIHRGRRGDRHLGHGGLRRLGARRGRPVPGLRPLPRALREARRRAGASPPSP